MRLHQINSAQDHRASVHGATDLSRTRYSFHYLHARHRKRKNFISKLLSDDGHILTSQVEKEKNVFDFYSNLLGESLDREVTINLDELAIPSFDLSELDAPFSEDEVWRTINSLPSDKAPGPDGFT